MKLLAIIILSFVTISTQGKDLTVHISTWNVNEKPPPVDLDKFLGQDTKVLPDILVIGLQEVTMSPVNAVIHILIKDVWTKTFTTRLLKTYNLVGSESTMGIVLNVFIKKEHTSTFQNRNIGIKKMGIGGLVGNKGGVITSFNLYSRKFCIVNAHFHAHDTGNSDRINDFKTINKVRDDMCSKSADYIFWSGDLNFRIQHTSLTEKAILETINKGKAIDMLKYDELEMTRKAGKIFNGFNEAPIKFNPTYKMIIDKGGYDLTRKPAWTDRILFKSDTSKVITPLFYRSLDNFKISDHNPVQAQFKITV